MIISIFLKYFLNRSEFSSNYFLAQESFLRLFWFNYSPQIRVECHWKLTTTHTLQIFHVCLFVCLLQASNTPKYFKTKLATNHSLYLGYFWYTDGTNILSPCNRSRRLWRLGCNYSSSFAWVPTLFWSFAYEIASVSSSSSDSIYVSPFPLWLFVKVIWGLSAPIRSIRTVNCLVSTLLRLGVLLFNWQW